VRLPAVGDPKLAKIMRDMKVPAPVERIVRTDLFATAFNREKLGSDMCKRIVDLECGHQAVTRNAKTCKCTACHEMILNGEDYEAFRNRR
jgi:hypothetical protein